MRFHRFKPGFARWIRTLTLAALGVFILAAMPAPAQSLPPITLDLKRLGVDDPAARRVAVTLTRGIRSGHDLNDPRLKTLRKRMFGNRSIGFSDLRALADAGDGLAALRLVKRLRENDPAVRPADLAHYYGIAAATGRVAGLYGLVRMLDQIDPVTTSPARLQVLQDILMAYAKAGNSVAAEAILSYHLAKRPFGPVPDALVRLAETGRGEGRVLIALQLASDLTQTHWDDPEALVRAKAYLDIALASNSVRISLIAANLLPVLDARIEALVATADLAEANG